MRLTSLLFAIVGIAFASDVSAQAEADVAPACERPAVETRYHGRAVLRRELERFRLEQERVRRSLPRQGTAGRDSGVARYRRAMAGYRRAAVHVRGPCRWMPDMILSLTASPAESTPEGDVIMLDVVYYYTGSHGGETSIGAITRLNGWSTGYWAYRPVLLAQGLHTARIRLAMNRSSPDTYRSDEVAVTMYVHRAQVFTERVFPLEHTWRRER